MDNLIAPPPESFMMNANAPPPQQSLPGSDGVFTQSNHPGVGSSPSYDNDLSMTQNLPPPSTSVGPMNNLSVGGPGGGGNGPITSGNERGGPGGFYPMSAGPGPMSVPGGGVPPSMMPPGPPQSAPPPGEMIYPPMPMPPYMPRNPQMMPQVHPHFRIHEMNKRLQSRPEENNILWWDSFVSEFFTDNACITLHFMMDDGPKRYGVGRGLIPRYFYTIFDSGCYELYYLVHSSRNVFPPHHVILDSEVTEMVMNMVRPYPFCVIAEGHLSVEFVCDEYMRIRNWIFLIRNHRELPSRNVMGEPCMEAMNKRITRNGMTAQVLNFLRLCVILEPMQELMSRQKAYCLSPRDCLKTTLFQKWQRTVSPPEPNRAASKRRKRKNNSGDSATKNNKRKQPLTTVVQNLAVPGDIMIVGEPTLMGNSFGENDERMITRLENSNYSSSSSSQQQQQQQPPMPTGPPSQQQQPPVGSQQQQIPPCMQPLPPMTPAQSQSMMVAARMQQQQQQQGGGMYYNEFACDAWPPPGGGMGPNDNVVDMGGQPSSSPHCVTPMNEAHRLG